MACILVLRLLDFDDILAVVTKEVNANSTVRLIRKQTQALIATAKSLIQTLREKVEEPWKV